MDCPDPDTLLALLGVEMPKDQRAAIEAHLDGCSECRALVADAARSRAEADTQDVVLDVLDERFEVGEIVGAGGMGAVHRGRDRKTSEAVAIKLLSAATDVSRFRREWGLLRATDHPGIVRYVAHGTTPAGVDYLVTEWLEGETLAEHLEHVGRLSIGAVVDLGIRIAEAVGALHERGVIHRDLKPANVFLVGGDLERIKVLDFGLARAAERGGGAPTAVTRTGVLLGTPGYMAPEQARGEASLDARVDVFSIGCILFRALVGRAPFSGGDLLTVLLNTVLAKREELESELGAAPSTLREELLAMLSTARDDRPADAGALAAPLRAIRASLSPEVAGAILEKSSAPALKAVERARVATTPPPRSRTLVLRIAALVAAAALLVWMGRATVKPEAPAAAPTASSAAAAPMELARTETAAPSAIDSAPEPGASTVRDDPTAHPHTAVRLPLSSKEPPRRKLLFDRRFVEQAIDGRIPAARLCISADKARAGAVSITFAPNGHSIGVEVATASNDAGFANCVRGVFSNMVVAPFEEPPQTVTRAF